MKSPHTIPLLVFAKAPIAGKVKTRLQPHCSAEQAVEIAKILLEDTLRQAIAHWPGPVILSVALDIQHEFVHAMSEKYAVPLVAQGTGNLGDRMSFALDQYGYPAAIIGSDAPHITKQSLTRAYQRLSNGNNVIGPSDDGGYYLIGLATACSALFQDIIWGGNAVLASTLERADQQSKHLHQLPPLNDVDTWPDLLAAAKVLPNLRHYLKTQQ
jgi:rSAM/selenodomain-associated transferase 1